VSFREFLASITDNWAAKVLCIMLAVGFFIFQRVQTMDSKGFDAHLVVIPNGGLVPTKPLPEYVRVTVETIKDDLAAISENDITVSIDLSTYSSTGTYNVPISVRTSLNVLYLDTIEINIRPNDLKITLDNKLGKYINVQPIFKGTVAQGYELTAQSIMPNQVWVEGPKTIVESLRSIPTEQIDITGRSNDIARVVNIGRIDPSLQINITNVQYSAKVHSIDKISEWSNVAILFINLNDKLKIKNNESATASAAGAAGAASDSDASNAAAAAAAPATATEAAAAADEGGASANVLGTLTSANTGVFAGYSGTMKLQGNILTVQNFKPESGTLYVDCEAISTPGEYWLSVMTNLPSDLHAISIDPMLVSITVEEGQT
jgi:hypothetical protein